MTKHETLEQALHAVQAAAPKLHTTETATVPTKGGGKYTYKYLGLDKLMNDVLPVLNEHGLAWFTQPSGTAGEPTLVYALVHVQTAAMLKGEMPLYLGGMPTAQSHGSAITYARRYALMAVLGLTADDDDGKGASGDHRDRVAPAPPSSSLLTPEQRDRVVAAVDDAGASLPLLLARVGAVSADDLTLKQAREIRVHLDEMNEEAERIAAEAFMEAAAETP